MSEKFDTSRGFPHPYGATLCPGGINFSLFSKHAREVSLCLFHPEDQNPFCEIQLNSKVNKTGNVWHLFVYNLPSHYSYGYRVAGPYSPLQGHYFDNRMILLDPYATQVASPAHWGAGKRRDQSHTHKGLIHPSEPFDWGGDAIQTFRPKI